MFSVSSLRRVPVHMFGRREPYTYDQPVNQGAVVGLADDARLFTTTFAGGLLFMSVYLA